MFCVRRDQGGNDTLLRAGCKHKCSSTGVFAYRLAHGSNRPGVSGLAFGVSVAMLDLGLIATQRVSFEWLFAVSALISIPYKYDSPALTKARNEKSPVASTGDSPQKY
jgi:hypothetical protein